MASNLMQPGEIETRHVDLARRITALRDKHPELADAVNTHIGHLDVMDAQPAVNLKGRM